MRAWVALWLASAAVAVIGSQTVTACGDKFLMVGRGVRFQRAYAAIHPASILIVLPQKPVKNAAILDSRLRSALKMAGHHIDLVQQPANLADVLLRSGYDIVLADQDEATAIGGLAAGGRSKPSVLGLDHNGGPLPDVLRRLDDAMKTRLDALHRAVASGG
jgi:hypothetical protein